MAAMTNRAKNRRRAGLKARRVDVIQVQKDCGGWSTLAREVLIRAARDAAGHSLIGSQVKFLPTEARAWLLSQDALIFFDLAGIPADMVYEWIDQGCPYKPGWAKRKGGELEEKGEE